MDYKFLLIKTKPKKMKKAILFFMLIILSITSYSQAYEVPKDYKLVLVEDYEPYEEDIIKTVNWLIESPIKSEVNKRKEANAFLLKWLMGAPKVKVGITLEATKLDCEDCLMIFMGAWAKDNIIKNEYDNDLESNLAGINAVIEFYSTNKKELGKNKAVEKMIKLKNKGKLKDFVEENMISE